MIIKIRDYSDYAADDDQWHLYDGIQHMERRRVAREQGDGPGDMHTMNLTVIEGTELPSHLGDDIWELHLDCADGCMEHIHAEIGSCYVMNEAGNTIDKF